MNAKATSAEVVQTRARPYRVLHVLDHSWPVLSGYSVRSEGLIQGQRRLGLEPRVLTGPLHQLDDDGTADSVMNGIRYSRTLLRGSIVRGAVEKRWLLLREAAVVQLLRRRILSIIRQENVDLVHAHSPALCGLAALQAARSANLPLVYEIRAFWEEAAVDQEKTLPGGFRYRVTRRLETYVASHAQAVVGISRNILKDMQARGLDRDKLFYVPNGVDAELHRPLPRDEQLAGQLRLGGDVVLGFAGSLYRYEGISWLVRALAELRRRGLSCTLLVLGEGEDMPAIKAAIANTGGQGHVLTLGRVPYEQVARYYSLMDVLVYPRRRIPLTELVTPLKPLEAMAQGKPVLASRVGGIQELVEEERTGLLFDPDDVEDFFRQARRLVEQPELRREVARQGRQMVLREKDWKVLAGRYAAVYDYASSARASRNFYQQKAT